MDLMSKFHNLISFQCDKNVKLCYNIPRYFHVPFLSKPYLFIKK